MPIIRHKELVPPILVYGLCEVSFNNAKDAYSNSLASLFAAYLVPQGPIVQGHYILTRIFIPFDINEPSFEDDKAADRRRSGDPLGPTDNQIWNPQSINRDHPALTRFDFQKYHLTSTYR